MDHASSKRPDGMLAANGLRAVHPADRAPARMQPLATLPMFAGIRGRPALVAGGEEGAAWKAELLAAAGADVVLTLAGGQAGFCEEAHALAARLADGASTDADTSADDTFGTLTLLHRAWVPADIFGHGLADATGIAADRPALALIDTRCHGEAAAFATIARAAGVAANAIDKPVHGDVQFGTIVNRSPVVVGISTDGAAPILGQAIRQRIEALLPPALAEWTGAMREARAHVLSLLPGRAARRAFFERFAEIAFRQPFEGGAPLQAGMKDAARGPIVDLAHAALEASRRPNMHGAEAPRGHVSIVGAGPGNAGLLTLNAVRALQAADVILFDALVSEEVLELARREARRMLVGKRAGRESCRQEDINALMLKLAGEGRRVVRLKSGDPMVFGRAGEEMDALRDAGIAFDVVPGITTAQGLAASLGLSLTHRETARSVRFVTGHGRDGQLPGDLDWKGLADPGTTLVVYMGARTAPLIAGRLIAEGMPGDIPALAASSVTRPAQRVWQGRLVDLAKGVATLDADQPILIAIGAAMELREETGEAVAPPDAARHLTA